MSNKVNKALIRAVLAKVKRLKDKEERHKWRNCVATYVGFAELYTDREFKTPAIKLKLCQYEDMLDVFLRQSEDSARFRPGNRRR